MIPAPKAQPDWWLALEHRNIERVSTLLKSERPPPIDSLGGPYGSTPLGWAAFTGDVALLQLLLDQVGALPPQRPMPPPVPVQ